MRDRLGRRSRTPLPALSLSLLCPPSAAPTVYIVEITTPVENEQLRGCLWNQAWLDELAPGRRKLEKLRGGTQVICLGDEDKAPF